MYNPFHKHSWVFMGLRVTEGKGAWAWGITWDYEQCRRCGKTRPKGSWEKEKEK